MNKEMEVQADNIHDAFVPVKNDKNYLVIQIVDVLRNNAIPKGLGCRLWAIWRQSNVQVTWFITCPSGTDQRGKSFEATKVILLVLNGSSKTATRLPYATAS